MPSFVRDPRRYYVSTGRFDAAALVLPVSMGVGAAVALGAIYAAALQFSPLLILNFVATALFGLGMGAAVEAGLVKAKVRSRVIGVGIGLGVALVGLGVSWMVWINLLIGVDAVREYGPILDPVRAGAFLMLVAEEGVWSVKNFTPTGAALWTIWAGEALFILAFTASRPWESTAKPFCERCEAWCDKVYEDRAVGPVDAPDALRRDLEEGRMEALEALPRPADGRFTQLTLWSCPSCDEGGFLSLDAVKVSVNRKGQQETKKNSLIHLLRLESDTLGRMRRFGEAG